MSKPKAKAKPKKLANPHALGAETAECGAMFNVSVFKSAETPHLHPCTCTILHSSDPVCHHCACAECKRLEAERHALYPKPTDFELLKRKLNDFGCQCRFDGEHDGVACEELDHDPCLVCLVNRIQISPGVTASGVRVTPTDATPRNGAASEATSATAPGDLFSAVDVAVQMIAGEDLELTGFSVRQREAVTTRLHAFRKTVLLEAAVACGNSGDMYIERAEDWILLHYGLPGSQ